MGIFHASHSPTGVILEGQVLKDIKNLTGQKTVSEGILFLNQEKGIYIPNFIEDFKAIIDFLIEFVAKVGTSTLYPNPTWAAEVPILIASLQKIKLELK